MKGIRNLAAACVAMAFLPACMWAPGQHLGRSSVDAVGLEGVDDRLEVIPITPKWLAMEQAAPGEASAIPAELLEYRPGEYRIGAGDLLYITVWDHPELTVPAGAQQQLSAAGRLVQSDGSLFYPYVGRLQVAGMTPVALREELSRRLARYIEDPQVDVSVITYASQRVWVTGATTNPGSLPLTVVPLTLSDAIAQSGLNPNVADLSGVRLTRGGRTWTLNLDNPAANSIYLQANDNIYIPFLDSKEVFVVGEVNQPGAQSFRTASISLGQALGRARGLTQTTANGNAVYVIRGSRDLSARPTRVYQLEARSPAAFGIASQFPLQPGDVVFVGAAGITRWSRFVNQLLPFASIISSSASAKNDLDN